MRGVICGPDGRLFLYGPFKRGGKHTAVSNAAFDTSLRDGNPEWGVRDVEALEELASKRRACSVIEMVEMPANNLMLAFGARRLLEQVVSGCARRRGRSSRSCPSGKR